MKQRMLLVSALTAALFALPAIAQIKVAAHGPMTGQYAAFGEQLKRGAEMAVADINAKGGVTGKKLELVIGDDACDPKQAVAIANKAVSDKVVFINGHFCSGSSIPASKVYAEAGVLQITPASTNPKFTDERPGAGVFRVVGRDDAQGLFAGTWIAKNFKGKQVAIIHDKSAYGKGVADETQKAMNKAGLKETMYEAYTAGEKDYAALVSKMKAGGIDAVYLGGYHTEGGLILRQMREQGLKAQFIGPDSLVTDEFWKITGDAGEGVLMTFGPDPRKNPNAKDAVAKFKAKNYDPEGYTLYTYAAMQVWAEAANAAKSTDMKKVVEVMGKTKFKTVVGDIVFDKKGDVLGAEYIWYVFSKGKYAEK
ncbi:MAG: branched-chain amino acid ABC transporter substrate-binding protein [Rhodoferax sp.]|nr:branched-chain amino acid ABC transporter substrate-binding protein [Rhodoferax sp.]